MGTEWEAPPALRKRIAADLRPVRPLLVPWKRVLALAPVVLALCLGVPLLVFSPRKDIAHLGPVLSWGASLAQAAVATLLAVAAYREVVPGRALPARRLLGLIGLGFALAFGITLLSWWVSPFPVPPGAMGRWARGCFRLSFRDGLPLLALMVILAARGYLARPALAGALAGTAAGLLNDAGWRLMCAVSDPQHVLFGHMTVVPVLAALGAALTWAVARVQGMRR